MSKHFKNEKQNKFIKHYIPNSKDNLKQIIIKVLFLLSLAVFIVSSVFIADYFLTNDKEDSIIKESRSLWHQNESGKTEDKDKASSPTKILLKQNSDFKGWITIDGTKIDNPIYQTDNNNYYINHNQNKEKSSYGALFFDCENVITEKKIDKNLVVFGHEMKNGSMFGQLKKLKNLSFYKEHSTIGLNVLGQQSVYRIYAVYILNAKKADDNGNIYNIYRQSFNDSQDFNEWVSQAKERSIIETKVEVEYGDDILTLVTCSRDFEDARLVVMAKKLTSDEDTSPKNSKAYANPNPKYPAKWYEERNKKS
ncbi:MAG: class B sortase [Clostridia bacterium]|nr:class B sortase [Clostridia bacterium]